MVDLTQAQAVDATGSGDALPASPRKSALTLGTLAALSTVSFALFWLPLRPEAFGANAIVLMCLLMMLRVPLAMAMLVPSLGGLYALGNERVVENVLGSLPYDTVTSWSLSVLPMFILMGMLMWQSGLSQDLFRAANTWLGWLPGGLAVGTNLAGTGLGAVSGSSSSITYALTRIGVPEMIKAGYSNRLALGSVIVAGLPGQLIPPSILLVLYAGVVEANVGQVLLAGVGPGLFISVMFTLMLVGFAVVERRSSSSTVATSTWQERFSSLTRVWPLPVLVVIVVGGVFSGIFTATEAGAAAALFSAIILFVWRRKQGDALSSFANACVGTVTSVGTIFLLLVGVGALGQMLNLSGISTLLANGVENLDLGRVGFLLLMMVIYLFLGAFMETLPMMVLTIPVLMPTLANLDVSLLWYGAFIVLMGEIGMITPPVGILTMIIYTIVREPEVNCGRAIGLKDIWVAALWYLPLALVVVVTLIFFPGIATWLPSVAGGG